MSFTAFLALKYLRPKRSVASAITLVSVLGVMLGVAAVIIVRSVMTGFGDEWERKILDFKPHVSVVPYASSVPGRVNLVWNDEELADRLRAVPGVETVVPEIDTRVMLANGDHVAIPVLIGVDAGNFAKAYKVGRPVAGPFDIDGDSVVLGVHLARRLGVRPGDEVVVYSPRTLSSQDEVFLPLKWRVAGLFSCGQYDYDSGYAVASLPNLRDLMGMERGVTAVHVKTARPADPVEFPVVAAAVADEAPSYATITWREADSELFNALAVEKNMTAILMMLISLVALFCVMNTLLVLTVQKTPEIGLLKSLGFSRLQILGVFMVHGMVQCSAGIALGLLASWAILSNLQRLVEWLAKMGLEVFPASVYGLSEIPHRIIPSDIAWTVALVYAFGLLASFVPAVLAAAKDPVKALNE